MIFFKFFEIIIWFFILFAISFLIGNLWQRIFRGRKYEAILFPGVIIHEFSHALGCLITGARIKSIKLFSSSGSYVAHTKAKIPIIGDMLISFAPVVGGILFVYLLTLIFNYDLAQLDLFKESFQESLFQLIKGAVSFSVNYYNQWQFWLFSYLTLSTIISLIPSKQDFKNSAISSLIIFLILSSLIYFDLFKDSILYFFDNYLINLLGLGIFFATIALLITLPIFIIKKIIL